MFMPRMSSQNHFSFYYKAVVILVCLYGLEHPTAALDYVFTRDFKRAILGQVLNPDPRGGPKFDINNEQNDVLRHSKDNRALQDEAYRWPKGILYYEYDSSLSERAKIAFEQAVADFHQFTCLRILPRSDQSQQDYVKVIGGKGCYSSIGRVSGMQEMSLGHGCEWKATAIHELMHAFGWEHEQMRLDRDDYIQLNRQNIRPGFEDNFAKMDGTVDSHQSKALTEYCYGSIMQYVPYAFSISDRLLTMEPKTDDPRVRMGQRLGLADCDIERIRLYYQCDASNANSLAPEVKYRCRNNQTGATYEDGQTFVQNRFLMQCLATGRNWSYVPIGCIGKSGQKYEANQTWAENSYLLRCNTDGRQASMGIVGCAPNGRSFSNGETWTDGSFIRKCVVEAGRGSQTIVGCFRNNQNYSDGQTWPEAGFLMRCTADAKGASMGPAGCIAQNQTYEVNQTWTEDDFVRRCFSDGRMIRVESIGCVGDSGQAAVGEIFTYRGYQAECYRNEDSIGIRPVTSADGEPRSPSGSSDNTTSVAAPSAPRAVVCRTADGRSYANGDTWRERSFKMQCKITTSNDGSYSISHEIVACYAQDNSEVLVGSQWHNQAYPNIPEFSLVWQCSKTPEGVSFSTVGCAANRNPMELGTCQEISSHIGITCTRNAGGISISTRTGLSPCGFMFGQNFWRRRKFNFHF